MSTSHVNIKKYLCKAGLSHAFIFSVVYAQVEKKVMKTADGNIMYTLV